MNNFSIKHALIVLLFCKQKNCFQNISSPSLFNFGYLEIFCILLNGTPDADILRGDLASVQLRFLVFENILKLLKIHIKKETKKALIELLYRTLLFQMCLLYFVH